MTDVEKAILRLTMLIDLFDDLSVNSNCVSVLLGREDEQALKTAIEALKEQRPRGEWITKGSVGNGTMRTLKHGCIFASEECAKNPCADCGVKEGDRNE